MYPTRPPALAIALAGCIAGLAACTQSQTAPAMGSGAAVPALPSGMQAARDRGSYDYDLDPAFSKALSLAAMQPSGQGTLQNDQTVGFGADRLLTFTYQQRFDCVVQPNDDRNYNGTPAALDPLEMRYEECQIGSPSSISPTGKPAAHTDPLYVLVPFFETDPSKPAFSKALGSELKQLFGFVPDAFKPDPGVPVQCPAPGDRVASCTMHPDHIDLGPVLAALGKVPPNTKVYTPIVDHSHLLPNGTVNQGQEWWQVVTVLVDDPKAWPNAQGTSGITSVKKLRAAQNKKQASADVPTNFFLFFSSQTMGNMRHGMQG
jgi:hypothetical protein